jgi:hypothetical protein
VKEYKKQLRDEMQVERLEKDIATIKAATRSAFKKAANEAGGIYSHSLAQLSSFFFDRWLFKENRFNSWKDRRVFYGV